MIKFLDAEFDGDSWEELCQKCFRLKYENEDYQRIPAEFGGDLGIEGYTRTGTVFQCYSPEQDYPPKELYEHQRDKITKDINKLLNNGAELKSIIGNRKIKKWCFVTPFYNNKELLKHCNSKKDEVLEQIKKKKLDYIENNFDIIILVSDDFQKEIWTLVNLNKNYKFSIQVKHTKKNNNWRECKSELVQNIIRKISAIVPSPNTDLGMRQVDNVVGIYMDYYLKGIKVLNLIQLKYPDLYEKLVELKNSCEDEIQIKCNLFAGTDKNGELFSSLMNDFSNKLSKQFSDIFSVAAIEELKNQIISSWLLYCPMDFR